MRAVVIDRFGGPEVLQIRDLPLPVPGPGQVVIQLAYAGVNPVDWKCREGWLAPLFEAKFPFVIGFAGAGVVSAVGPEVVDFRVGDRVVTNSDQAVGENGTYAEYVRVSAGRVAHLAQSVDFATAASIPTSGVTSWESVFGSGELQSGQSVLINGGAGGMGSFAIQFAKYAGARVAATCGPQNVEYVRELGADLAIDYRCGDVQAAVLDWAPGGVDLLVDLVGQGTIRNGVEMVKRGGRVVPIGTLVKGEPSFDLDLADAKGIRIIPTMSKGARAGEQLRIVADLFGKGLFRSPALAVLPLSEAAEAHRRVQDGHVRGKIVLKISTLEI